LLVTFFALALAAAQQAPAATPPAPPAAAAARAFGPQSTFDAMAADVKVRAILDRHVPLIMQAYDGGAFPGVATLDQVAQDATAQSAGGFTAEAYKAILADLEKL
jgi:hypothetical protein